MLTRLLFSIADRRAPDFVIGGSERPYLRRWWVIPRNPIFNIYLHQFLRDDDDRALHDHPWFNLSILLRGQYREHTRTGAVVRRAGGFKLRSPWAAHRIELIDGEPCWTLFITGPRQRQWGFWCPQGWRHWKLFVDGKDAGSIGRGCD